MDYCKIGCRENALLLEQEEDILDSIAVDVKNTKTDLACLPTKGIREYRARLIEIQETRAKLEKITKRIRVIKQIKKSNDMLLNAISKTAEFSVMLFSLMLCLDAITVDKRNEEMNVFKYCISFAGWTVVQGLRFLREKSSADAIGQSQRRLENYKKHFKLLEEVNAMLLTRLDASLAFNSKKYSSGRKVFIMKEKRHVGRPFNSQERAGSSFDDGDVDEPQPHSGNSSECF